MDFPDETLKALLLANWTLTTESITDEDVTFTTEDWSEAAGIHTPYVSVRHIGLTRISLSKRWPNFHFWFR